MNMGEHDIKYESLKIWKERATNGESRYQISRVHKEGDNYIEMKMILIFILEC